MSLFSLVEPAPDTLVSSAGQAILAHCPDPHQGGRHLQGGAEQQGEGDGGESGGGRGHPAGGSVLLPLSACQPGGGGELCLRVDGAPEPGRAQGTVSRLPQQIRIGQEQLVGLFCHLVFCVK